LSDSKTLVISVNNTAPSVKITSPNNNAQYTLLGASQLNLKANVTDNDLTGMQYAWQVTLRHNNHEHPEPINTQQNPTVQISPVGCDGDTYYYLICVKITDNGGLTAKDSVKIYPNCNSQNLNVTNLLATSQNNAVALQWTSPIVPFDEVMLVAKASSGFTTSPSGTAYTADANFTGNGTAFEGGKVLFKGIGNNVTVTNLVGGTKYFFRAFTRKGTSWTGGVETSATPTSPITQQLGCLKGSYFNNITLTGTPVVVRAESSINYDWGTAAPVTGINADNFSVRWEGTIIPNVSGTYTFSVTGDDGIRLWVNNQLLVDKWIDQGATTYNAKINLTATVNVPVKVEYYERSGGATAKLFCTAPNQTSKVAAFTACPLPANFSATKCYRFTAAHSGKVMEVVGNSTKNDAAIQQNTWASTKAQVWRIKAVDATYYRIMNGNSGKALEMPKSSTVDGTVFQQNTYNSTTNQQFKFETIGSNFNVSVRHSGKYLDVNGASIANNATIIQWPKNGGTNQQWTVGEVGCPSGTVALVSSRIYSAEGYREGRKGIITWVSNASDADYFNVEKLNKNGDFEILDVVNAKPVTEFADKNYYSFTDNQTNDGENIYRVTLIIDSDTPPQYSNLVTLNFRTLNDFVLYPNPANDFVDVDLVPYEQLPVLMTVIDVSGREVRFSSIERAKKTHRVNLEGLMSGQYILRIHTEGKRDITRLFNITR
jgi:PA14 domain/Ricin-type beta-trefoil lectin domain-like/Secretion system C-terminal sorting domain